MSENEKPDADDELIEQMAKTSPAFAAFVEERIAKRKEASGRPMLHKTPLSAKIPWDAHFGPTEIKPGETAALQDMPQVLFRGKKMIAFADDDAALDDLHMQAFFVGKKSQLRCNGESISFRRIAKGMTAEELCPGVRGIENGFDTCEKALTLTICVVNQGSVPRTARLTLMGKAIR